MSDLFTKSSADFSEDRRYRYTLKRVWDEERDLLNFVMLNPSQADELTNDPTVERCERRAADMGYGGLVVTNLFALRSTDPQALYDSENPVGDGNDDAILAAALDAQTVICAWGTHGAYMNRGKEVARMLHRAGVNLFVLTQTADGTPGHPLYVAYERKPYLWKEGKAIQREEEQP